jgi:hypothetical protein
MRNHLQLGTAHMRLGDPQRPNARIDLGKGGVKVRIGKKILMDDLCEFGIGVAREPSCKHCKWLTSGWLRATFSTPLPAVRMAPVMRMCISSNAYDLC